MKLNYLLLGLVLACSSFLAINEASAQGCRAELMSGNGGIIIDIFNGSNCTAVNNSCNNRLRQLRYQDPYFYRDAYCNIVDSPRHVNPRNRPFPHSVQPRPQGHVTKAYDRCQAPGIVRCTQEWSDGRVITEDYSCSGCKGYSKPSGDPCGWMCSFPEK